MVKAKNKLLGKGILLFLIGTLLLLPACKYSNTKNMTIYNLPDADEVHIGVVYPVEIEDLDTYYHKGVELAVEHINSRGGVLGKNLRIIVRDDKDDGHVAMQIANTFFEQGITAVIGHHSTNISYFVKDLYEENKVIMLTPIATGTNLFERESNYIYRIIADNRELAASIAGYMAETGLSRIAIYFSNDVFGLDFSFVLEDEMSKRGIVVIDRVSSVTPASIDAIMDRWRAFGCDGIVLAATSPRIIEPAQLINMANPNLPIFGADTLQKHSFLNATKSFDDAVNVALYPIGKIAPDFLEAFISAYGHGPGIHAISGYAAVNLLADAMNATGSTGSEAIAGFLSNLKDYEAIVGTLTFNPKTREFDGYKLSVHSFAYYIKLLNYDAN
ncbi:MAG: ABC transporter substrate-binding protein [Treponema sp.]|jgi:branched-chain amino acid transport system substrate-binding protein|nr:ABC transporter substrate-binding protein [Treponema sp.]